MAYDYAQRARELLLDAATAASFIALNEYADTVGECPSCGDRVKGYEQDRLRHAQTCPYLRKDAGGK
jgi:hypothetical protein